MSPSINNFLFGDSFAVSFARMLLIIYLNDPYLSSAFLECFTVCLLTPDCLLGCPSSMLIVAYAYSNIMLLKNTDES